MGVDKDKASLLNIERFSSRLSPTMTTDIVICPDGKLLSENAKII
jgi:hypothetical protein